MKLFRTNRSIHYWLSLAALLPLLIIVCTGMLLQVKKYVAWIQPPTAVGADAPPALHMADILARARGVPELAVADWADISRVDYRPKFRAMKVVAKNGWEAQLCASTGKILQVAKRRSDTIEALHDGSWFHEGVRLGIFLPAAIILLLLTISGAVLLWQPYHRRVFKKG